MAMCRLLIFSLLFNDTLYLVFYIGILIKITLLLMEEDTCWTSHTSNFWSCSQFGTVCVCVNAGVLGGTPPSSKSGLHCVLAERSRETDLTS